MARENAKQTMGVWGSGARGGDRRYKIKRVLTHVSGVVSVVGVGFVVSVRFAIRRRGVVELLRKDLARHDRDSN